MNRFSIRCLLTSSLVLLALARRFTENLIIEPECAPAIRSIERNIMPIWNYRFSIARAAASAFLLAGLPAGTRAGRIVGPSHSKAAAMPAACVVGDDLAEGDALYNKALGQMDKALDSYNRALAIYQKLNNDKGIADIFQNVGLIYHAQKLDEKALENMSRALAINQKLNRQSGVADSYYNMGLSYYALNQHDKALDSYNRGLDIYRKLDNQRYIADSCQNLSLVYGKLGQEDKAKEFRDRAEEIYKKVGR
jgi:tetratricopeptide (TPR) repeat protein